MGTVASTSYKQIKRVTRRYNAINRALKLVEKEKLPPASSNFFPALDKREILKNNPELEKELEALKCKDKQLDEYLKKVYLTSTSKNPSFVSKKPLPMKTNRSIPLVVQEIKCSPGCCTLNQIIEMLVLFGEDHKKWSPTVLAEKFLMDKNTVVHILMYYGLFKKEDFGFMNREPVETEQKIEFEVFTQLEKKPTKLIEGKKS